MDHRFWGTDAPHIDEATCLVAMDIWTDVFNYPFDQTVYARVSESEDFALPGNVRYEYPPDRPF